MVTFVVEKAPYSATRRGRFQMRNEFNDDVKRRGDNPVDLVRYALEYSAYQGTDVRVDLPREDMARVAKRLGSGDMPGFDLGL